METMNNAYPDYTTVITRLVIRLKSFSREQAVCRVGSSVPTIAEIILFLMEEKGDKPVIDPGKCHSISRKEWGSLVQYLEEALNDPLTDQKTILYYLGMLSVISEMVVVKKSMLVRLFD